MEDSFYAIVALALIIIFAQMRRIRKLAHDVIFDSLTGLYNRRYVTERLKELGYARQSGLPVAIIYLDVDKLKPVNDKLGHDEGNSYLCKVARIIQAAVRKADTVGRLGGDEFIVIMPNADFETGQAVASRISEKCSEISFKKIGHGSISFGVAARETESQTIEEIMRLAEEKMYEQKKTKNCHR
jgi:diguanylate cyclase (GGDEF)-like protein